MFGNDLKEEDFTDRTDATFEIALYEYGLVRNPKTGETAFCINTTDDFKEDYEYEIVTMEISAREIQEALEEISDGYFDFIGSDRKTELKNIDNEYLTHHIRAMNMYNGWFDPRY